MIDHTLVQESPWITAVINGHTAELTIDGERQQFSAVSAEALRQTLMGQVLEAAARVARPVRMTVVDENGSEQLIVAATGEIEPDGVRTPRRESSIEARLGGEHSAPAVEDEPERTRLRPRPTPPVGPPPVQPAPGPSTGMVPRPAYVAPQVVDQAQAPVVPPQPAVAPVTPPAPPAPAGPMQHDGRPSFITVGRSVQPATQGWRKAANAFGLRLSPGREELAYRADVDAVARLWPGTRTVSVLNPKGSASKTPTVACLSAIFARLAGGGVLAWDNNETEGTLRFRTEWAPHQASMLNVLPDAERLLAPTAPVGEMSRYVHHQPADKYDVLWSDTTVDGDHVVSAADVELIHRVASRYYRMLIMDSGNNARAANWRTMIEHSDAVVVPCTEVEDTAEVGARLLETLRRRGGRSAHLAANALVLVSQRTEKGANADRIANGFRGLARAVVQIPYDPALETGVIRFDSLRPETRRAWLRAAATLTEAL